MFDMAEQCVVPKQVSTPTLMIFCTASSASISLRIAELGLIGRYGGRGTLAALEIIRLVDWVKGTREQRPGGLVISSLQH